MDPILLGDVARDVISGFEGLVIAKTEWLHGCDRLTLAPQKLHDGKVMDNATFDRPQLELVTPGPRHATNTQSPMTGGPRPEPVRGR